MQTGFKKKSEIPETIPSFDDKINMILGLGSQTHLKGKISRDFILSYASFWDSKKRIDKIKTLILKDQQLEAFEDTDDFRVDELLSIQLLSLSKNKIRYLQPIRNLDTLLCLNINFNKIYDLSPVSQLTKLEELYSSNNKITNIDPLSSLQKLRIINLYENKINRFDESIKILHKLSSLEELDIQNNPIYSKETRKNFLYLSLVRLNGDLILEEEKGKEVGMSTSCLILPASKFKNTRTSFFNASEVSETQKFQSMLNKLENISSELDERFEAEIVKNVKLKKKYHEKITDKKRKEKEKEELKEKAEEIRELKRKVKNLKQNLFTKDQKGELLRAIFDKDMQSSTKNSQFNPIELQKREAVWSRRFDFDEQIVIQENMSEDEEIEMFLSNTNSAIQQLKRELREIRQ